MKILQNKKNNEIKIESQDYRDIVKGFMVSLQSVKSDQELMNWMQRVAKSYELTKKANQN